MTATAAILGGLGIACVLMKRSILGLVVGFQILLFGAALLFAIDAVADAKQDAQVSALLVIIMSLAEAIVGVSIAARVFFLTREATVDETRALRN